jgi:hypothetical protein
LGELIILLSSVSEANPDGDLEWKNAIRYAMLEKSKQTEQSNDGLINAV